jgi:hypothetical protein
MAAGIIVFVGLQVLTLGLERGRGVYRVARHRGHEVGLPVDLGQVPGLDDLARGATCERVATRQIDKYF